MGPYGTTSVDTPSLTRQTAGDRAERHRKLLPSGRGALISVPIQHQAPQEVRRTLCGVRDGKGQKPTGGTPARWRNGVPGDPPQGKLGLDAKPGT